MALQLIEGFDHYSSTILSALKGWTFSAVGGVTPSFGAGRINGTCFAMACTPATTGQIQKDLGTNFNPITLGFAFQMNALPTGNASIFLINPTGSGVSSANIAITAAGKVCIETGGPGGAVVATGTALLVTGAWFYIEVKINFNGAASTVSTQVNGAADIPNTVVNLPAGGVGAFTCWSRANDWTGSAITSQFDDIYLCDTSGALNTGAFLGDSHVETIYPASDGTHQAWTPNTGLTHFNLVNEHTVAPYPDEDTTYVADSNSGDADSYNYTPLVFLLGTIFGLQTNLWSRKDDAALRQIKPLIRIAGVDYLGNAATLGTSYVDATQIYDASPATAAHFTIAEVNGAQFGVEVV